MTNVQIAGFYLERRNQRLHKVKLADRTDILAETGAAEKAIYDHGCHKISDDNPSGQPGTIPQTKGFIRPEINRKQAGRDPFRAQPSRPLPVPRQDTAPKIARKSKRTSKTKEVPEHEQR